MKLSLTTAKIAVWASIGLYRLLLANETDSVMLALLALFVSFTSSIYILTGSFMVGAAFLCSCASKRCLRSAPQR